MRLWPGRHEQQVVEPDVDRDEAMAQVLRRHATRGSRAVNRAQIREQSKARREVKQLLQSPPPHPVGKGLNEPRHLDTLHRPQKTQAPPDFAAFTSDAPALGPDEAPPVYDESLAARLRRRYGSDDGPGGWAGSGWRWT